MQKNVLGKVLLALVIVSALAYGWQPAKAEVQTVNMTFPIKIMALGDSITASLAPMSSYRCYLDHSLHAAGIPFLYSGSRTADSYGNPSNPCGSPLTAFDPHNEGYSGAMAWDFLHEDNWSGTKNTIDNILSRTVSFYDGTSGPNIPDMVLIHLGTNDLGHNPPHSLTQIISDLGSIIENIRARNPKVVILIAQIIPCRPYDWCFNVDDLNALIPGLATAKNTVDSPVVVVDMFTGYDALIDNAHIGSEYVHPNSTGDAIIAARWMAAINAWWNTAFIKTYIPAVMNQ